MKAVNKCIRCFRMKPRVVEHIMADLPKSLALTFAGARSKPPVKCFATKAIHLELIKDLSTVSFLHGLKRFICTRRWPRKIWSHNETNFVGARNELLELRRLFLRSDHQRATLDFGY